LSPDAIENCIKAWKWRQIQAQKPQQLELKSIDNGSGAKNTQPQPESVSLRDRITKILATNLGQSGRKEAFIELSHTSGCHIREIEQLAEILAIETSQQETRSDTVAELARLLEATEASAVAIALKGTNN
jgi:hypothetical protein